MSGQPGQPWQPPAGDVAGPLGSLATPVRGNNSGRNAGRNAGRRNAGQNAGEQATPDCDMSFDVERNVAVAATKGRRPGTFSFRKAYDASERVTLDAILQEVADGMSIELGKQYSILQAALNQALIDEDDEDAFHLMQYSMDGEKRMWTIYVPGKTAGNLQKVYVYTTIPTDVHKEEE